MFINTEYEIGAKALMEDRNLFYCSALRVTSALRDIKSAYGILPFPKYDALQNEYISDVSQSTVLWCIPVTASDYSLTSKFCEVFAHYSRENMIPAYYEVSLQEKYSRDSDTKEMLQIIRDSLRLTPDGYLNHCFSVTPFNTFTWLFEKNQEPASYFAANETALKARLNDIFAAYN